MMGATGGLPASAEPHGRTSRPWHPAGKHTLYEGKLTLKAALEAATP